MPAYLCLDLFIFYEILSRNRSKHLSTYYYLIKVEGMEWHEVTHTLDWWCPLEIQHFDIYTKYQL